MLRAQQDCVFEGVQVALDSGSMVRMEKCAKGKLGVISNSPLVPADSYPLSLCGVQRGSEVFVGSC